MLIARCIVVLLMGHVCCAVLTWDSEQVTVKQGDSFNVTCTATDMDLLDILRLQLVTGDGHTVTIDSTSSNKLPHIDFRYSCTGTNCIATLSYRGVRVEDAGTLLCTRLGRMENTVEMKLIVAVPVKDIFLISTFAGAGVGQKVVNSTDIVQMRETYDMGVGCIVVMEGAMITPPDLKIQISVIDQTRYFAFSHSVEQQSSSRVVPTSSRYTYQLVYQSMKPERHFNQQQMICSATALGFEPIAVKTQLNVEYKPVILCQQYEYYASLEDDVTIVCNVEANPVSRVTLTGESDQLKYEDMLSEKILKSDVTEIRVSILSTSLAHYGAYYITAFNDIGMDEVTVMLHRVVTDIADQPLFAGALSAQLPAQLLNNPLSVSRACLHTNDWSRVITQLTLLVLFNNSARLTDFLRNVMS